MNRGARFGFHGHQGLHHISRPVFHRRFFPRHFRHHGGFFSGSFGFSSFGFPIWYGYPGVYSSYDCPVMSYASDYYPAVDTSNLATVENQRRIEDRLDRLEERLNRLLEARSEASNQPSSPAKAPQPERSPATMLVFRDKHTEEVNNYAIVGGTMWVFTEERARKLRVADLDLPATARQNEERGVEFQLK